MLRRAYLELNRGVLEREAAQQRAEAASNIAQSSASSRVSQSVQEWTEWLGQNRELFQTKLRAIRGGLRRCLNKRFECLADLPGAPSINLAPNTYKRNGPPWVQHTHNGFFAIRAATDGASCLRVLLAARAARQVWAVPLSQAGTEKNLATYSLPLRNLHDVFRPIGEVLPSELWAGVSLYSIKMSCIQRDEAPHGPCSYLPSGS